MDLTITAAIARIKADVAHYLTPEAIKFVYRKVGYTWRGENHHIFHHCRFFILREAKKGDIQHFSNLPLPGINPAPIGHTKESLPMPCLPTLLLLLLLAALHLLILTLENYPLNHPLILQRLEAKLGFAEGQGIHAAPIVKNAGLYNGFLAAGLFWAALARDQAKSLRLFFLTCVILAGIFGALTLPSPLALYLQTIPGLTAFIVCLLPNRAGVFRQQG